MIYKDFDWDIIWLTAKEIYLIFFYIYTGNNNNNGNNKY